MSVSICIASRGRPQLLRQTIDTLVAGMVLDTTRISVAIDRDELRIYEPLIYECKRVASWSVADRDDSLGAKYNRAQRALDPSVGTVLDSLMGPDLFVLWPDDAIMPQVGWDESLLKASFSLSDGCGVVLFGKVEGVLQPGLALTQKFIDAQGFFCQPHTPYWWHETWTLEVASMAGCAVHAEVEVKLLQELKGKSQGVREICFWAELFDRLRPARRKVAEAISPARARSSLNELERQWAFSNSKLRDPVQAAALEKFYGGDNPPPPDERYFRLKAKAQAMLDKMRSEQSGPALIHTKESEK